MARQNASRAPSETRVSSYNASFSAIGVRRDRGSFQLSLPSLPFRVPNMIEMTATDRIRGTLLGGAVGDALGGAIEFMHLSEIRNRFGQAGAQDYAPAYGRRGAITDDTQMSLFTAEGLIRAWVRAKERGICSPPGVIHHAYFRWLLTQNEHPAADIKIGTDGWLFATPGLHSRRAPGNTCLAALRNAAGFGEPSIARNDSKGCGGVMRVAPIGLFAPAIGDDEQVFTMAVEAAALTHGHPTGFLAAGYLAVVVAALCRGKQMVPALDDADSVLRRRKRHTEVKRAIDAARKLAAAGRPTPEKLETLGGGWVAEEALAIGICCAMVANNFADGVLLAVNHSGDSDSTGSIAGNLLGAQLGVASIPTTWLDELELRAEIDRVATDLDAIAHGRMTPEEAWQAYPGW